jgi:hypothetical protein
MRFSASKGFGCSVIILLIMNMLAGCATTHRTSMDPPPRLKKELDSLKSNTTTSRPAKPARSSRYTIKQGDTIWRIAFNHGCYEYKTGTAVNDTGKRYYRYEESNFAGNFTIRAAINRVIYMAFAR